MFIKTDISNKKKISKILQRNDYDAVMHFAGLVKVDESLKKRQRVISDFKNSLGQLKRKIEKQDLSRIMEYLQG